MRETIGFLRRTFSRLDVSSRSMFAVIEQGSCFAGTLLELALAADRSYMLDAEDGPQIALSRAQLRHLPDGERPVAPADAFLRRAADAPRRASCLTAEEASKLGLVTATPDDIDWEDEVRIAIEERASLSPDALTGMEASLRFAGPRDHGDARLRPPHGVAELDLHPAQRGRRAGRAEGLRHRRESEIQLGESVMSGINYSEKIPNNVNLVERPHAAARARALAAALPRLVEGHGAERLPVGRRLPAHRDLGRRAGLGALRHGEDARLPLGHLPRRSAAPSARSASATRWASRCGSRCRASTARRCAA